MKAIAQLGTVGLAAAIAKEIEGKTERCRCLKCVRLDVFATLSGPVYLSIDVDSLDPAVVPGVAYPEPGLSRG